MSIIDEINTFVSQTTVIDSLSGHIRNIINNELKPKPSPTSHYTVTQLVNPAGALFSKLNPDISDPPELGRKFAHGKHLQYMAGYWFNDLPNFMVEEGTLDGKWVGIDKVRGRYDYLINDSIIEFKTKDKNPMDENEVLSAYPQDLEQLAFYSTIHPSKPKINYLVFMENSGDHNLKVFRVDIINFKQIEKILTSRIADMDYAIENKDPSVLGRCRYHQFGCKFIGTCSCDQMPLIDIDSLQKALTIVPDKEMTQILEDTRKATKKIDIFCLTIYNIIAPRKHYMNHVVGHPFESYSDTRTDEYKSCLRICINKMKNNLKINLNQEKNMEIRNLKQDNRVLIGHNWINYKQSGSSEDQQLPYLIKVGTAKTTRGLTASQYHKAELGIICGLYKKANGLIFIVYPELNNLIMTYKVDFSHPDELNSYIKARINTIEVAERNKDLSSLPECIKFQCAVKQGGRCHLEEQCFPIASVQG